MASCLHEDLQLGQDMLYRCAACDQLFVVEPADVTPEPTDGSEPDAPPAEEAPEVDISRQLRVYLAGKPREVPASARRRKAKPR